MPRILAMMMFCGPPLTPFTLDRIFARSQVGLHGLQALTPSGIFLSAVAGASMKSRPLIADYRRLAGNPQEDTGHSRRWFCFDGGWRSRVDGAGCQCHHFPDTDWRQRDNHVKSVTLTARSMAWQQRCRKRSANSNSNVDTEALSTRLIITSKAWRWQQGPWRDSNDVGSVTLTVTSI